MKNKEKIVERRIEKLEKSLHCAFVETQIYKELLAEMRIHLKMVQHYLTYKPDKDRELHKSIWGYK